MKTKQLPSKYTFLFLFLLSLAAYGLARYLAAPPQALTCLTAVSVFWFIGIFHIIALRDAESRDFEVDDRITNGQPAHTRAAYAYSLIYHAIRRCSYLQSALLAKTFIQLAWFGALMVILDSLKPSRLIHYLAMSPLIILAGFLMLYIGKYGTQLTDIWLLKRKWERQLAEFKQGLYNADTLREVLLYHQTATRHAIQSVNKGKSKS